MSYTVHHGDSLHVMPTLDADSVDAIVCDPPYGLSFMGKNWDHGVPGEAFWREALRVAKPGAHLLAFGGTRTYHRLACAIEDAGWEVRDCIAWVYGSGFPKSHNLKGEWQGWGTALKPAYEPIIVARKPLTGTVAENVLKHGTGAINVDGCRVGTDENFGRGGTRERTRGYVGTKSAEHIPAQPASPLGRWPANFIHDGSEEVVGLFPESGNGNGKATVAKRQRNKGWCNSSPGEGVDAIDNYGDSGSAARFFYCAKASKADREEGLADMPCRDTSLKYNGGDGFAGRTLIDGEWVNTDKANRTKPRNHHPTVKPTALMRYLCRLVTPPGGVVFDPFTGSGSTGKAAMLEGFRFIGIERESEYVDIARARIAAAAAESPLFAGAVA